MTFLFIFSSFGSSCSSKARSKFKGPFSQSANLKSDLRLTEHKPPRHAFQAEMHKCTLSSPTLIRAVSDFDFWLCCVFRERLQTRMGEGTQKVARFGTLKSY